MLKLAAQQLQKPKLIVTSYSNKHVQFLENSTTSKPPSLSES